MLTIYNDCPSLPAILVLSPTEAIHGYIGEYHETDPPFIIEADPGLIIEIDPPLIM